MKRPLLSDKTYDVLKHSAAVALPALGTLYFALAQIWHLPKAEEVIGSIAAINAFIGAIVSLSKVSYNKSDAKYAGVIQVDDTGEKKSVSLVVHGDPEEILSSASEVTFKVSDTGETPIVNPTQQ